MLKFQGFVNEVAWFIVGELGWGGIVRGMGMAENEKYTVVLGSVDESVGRLMFLGELNDGL